MDTGPRGAPQRDPPHDIEVEPVLAPRATRLGLAQGTAVAVAMLGLVVIALWLAGVGATGQPPPAGAVGTSGARAAISPTPSPTGVAAATLPSTGPSPVVPAVPCNTRTPPPSLGVTLIIGSGGSSAGSTASSGPPTEVAVTPGARLLLILGAEDCALAWDIVVTPVDEATPVFEDALSNPTPRLAYGMQNRWEVPPLPPGDYLLSAHLVALDGQSVVAAWHLHVGGALASATVIAIP